MKTAALSIGNTHISAALVNDLQVQEKKSVPVRSPGDWPALIDWIQASRCPAVTVSVNSPVFEALEERFPDRLILVGRDLPVPMKNLTQHPEQTGHDRLLTGFAASKLYDPPLLVVDFGTAFTFNVIDADGAFAGGAIAPGLSLAIRALAEGCAQLKEVERPSDPVPLIGLDTDAAIRSGLFNGYLGLVESLTERLLGEGSRTVATGGDAEYFLRCSSLFSLNDPDLLLKGVALAHEAYHRS